MAGSLPCSTHAASEHGHPAAASERGWGLLSWFQSLLLGSKLGEQLGCIAVSGARLRHCWWAEHPAGEGGRPSVFHTRHATGAGSGSSGRPVPPVWDRPCTLPSHAAAPWFHCWHAATGASSSLLAPAGLMQGVVQRERLCTGGQDGRPAAAAGEPPELVLAEARGRTVPQSYAPKSRLNLNSSAMTTRGSCLTACTLASAAVTTGCLAAAKRSSPAPRQCSHSLPAFLLSVRRGTAPAKPAPAPAQRAAWPALARPQSPPSSHALTG